MTGLDYAGIQWQQLRGSSNGFGTGYVGVGLVEAWHTAEKSAGLTQGRGHASAGWRMRLGACGVQCRELPGVVDWNYVGAHCCMQKRIQGTKNKNGKGIGIDDWYGASGLAGALFSN